MRNPFADMPSWSSADDMRKAWRLRHEQAASIARQIHSAEEQIELLRHVRSEKLLEAHQLEKMLGGMLIRMHPDPPPPPPFVEPGE